MIDFDIPAELAALGDEIRAFVTEQIVPYEADPRLTWGSPMMSCEQSWWSWPGQRGC
jgi:hypothetical protein